MEANSTGGQGSRRAIAPSDDDDDYDDDDNKLRMCVSVQESLPFRHTCTYLHKTYDLNFLTYNTMILKMYDTF